MSLNYLPKIGALITARLDTRAWHERCILPLGEYRLVGWAINALKRLENVETIMCVSDQTCDCLLPDVARHYDIPCFTGSKKDLAKRIIDCCEAFDFDYFFLLDGEAPFVNLPLLRTAIRALQEEEYYDFISNKIEATYPVGIDCELHNLESFKKLYPLLSIGQREAPEDYIYYHDGYLQSLKYKSLRLPFRNYTHHNFFIRDVRDMRRLSNFVDNTVLKDFNDLAIEDLILHYDSVPAYEPHPEW